MRSRCMNIFLVMVMVACMQEVQGCRSPCQKCKAKCCSRWFTYPPRSYLVQEILSNEQRIECEEDCDNRYHALKQCPDLQTLLDEYEDNNSFGKHPCPWWGVALCLS